MAGPDYARLVEFANAQSCPLPGPDHCGAVSVADLGLELNKLVRTSAWVAGPELFSMVLKRRPRNFHKGQAGSLAILGGASGMAGAAPPAGGGAAQGERAETLVGAGLASDIPCVLDADALNLVAENDDLRGACARRRAETLATPHPAEAARLLKLDTAGGQADRVAAARRPSRELK